MKKNLWVIPLILLVLSSCNFPLFKQKETSNAVATRVAMTLAAINSTATPETVIVTATPESSATPSVTPTQTVAPSLTPVPDDPKLSLGTPSFAETFDKKSSFGLQTPYIDDAVTMSITDGSLLMVSSRAQGGTRWRLTYPTPDNFYLEGTFTTVSCSGKDEYGLVLRSPSYTDGKGYYFGINCAGQYAFFSWDGSSDPNFLVDWSSDPALLAGPNQTNRIGVMVKDDHFSLYLNGKLVKDFSDSKYKEPGHFGVYISAIETANFTVQVNDIDEWNQP